MRRRDVVRVVVAAAPLLNVRRLSDLFPHDQLLDEGLQAAVGAGLLVGDGGAELPARVEAAALLPHVDELGHDVLGELAFLEREERSLQLSILQRVLLRDRHQRLPLELVLLGLRQDRLLQHVREAVGDLARLLVLLGYARLRRDADGYRLCSLRLARVHVVAG